jgi:hypothetical protein
MYTGGLIASLAEIFVRFISLYTSIAITFSQIENTSRKNVCFSPAIGEKVFHLGTYTTSASTEEHEIIRFNEFRQPPPVRVQ